MTRRPSSLHVSLGVLFAVAIGCGVAAPTPDPQITPTQTVPVSPVDPTTAGPAPSSAAARRVAPATVGDGQYEVGAELKAGTYTTTVPADTFGCYWARLKSFDGELKSIIANNNLTPGAKGRVVVKATDKGVEFTGGCEWSKAAVK